MPNRTAHVLWVVKLFNLLDLLHPLSDDDDVFINSFRLFSNSLLCCGENVQELMHDASWETFKVTGLPCYCLVIELRTRTCC